MSLNLLTIVGARPQFVKAATVSRAIARHNASQPASNVVEKIVHTGQHYDDNMSEVFFRELEIPHPAHHLGIGSGGHGAQTGRMLAEIEHVLLEERPDVVMVYGDTNSTLAGALAAAKLHTPIAHVEAGLRSFNRRMPEEINRVLTDHLANWLFCPTQTAVDNLKTEGITRGVYDVGDVMFDGLLYSKSASSAHPFLERLGIKSGGYAFATAHRAENTESFDRLRDLVATVEAVADVCGTVVLPLHPRTQHALATHGLSFSRRVLQIAPVPYLEMIPLVENARLVLTDSGGVQKEAFFLGVACITMREETEWVETVSVNANRLVGLSPLKAAAAAGELVCGVWVPDFSSRPYGTGAAADAIVAILARSGQS
jgi:UDP-GlcNAc3NAcA epimerase